MHNFPTCKEIWKKMFSFLFSFDRVKSRHVEFFVVGWTIVMDR